MKRFLTGMLLLTTSACAKPADNSSVKSEYPYDIAALVSCQTDGPVRICRGSQTSHVNP